mmetsp:Transcript_10060/g.28955  ORF Transcript_10060/g.28955 Transcript_10060/m.28955 type:complete len:132 (-) Transcript_10060:16-411(-)
MGSLLQIYTPTTSFADGLGFDAAETVRPFLVSRCVDETKRTPHFSHRVPPRRDHPSSSGNTPSKLCGTSKKARAPLKNTTNARAFSSRHHHSRGRRRRVKVAAQQQRRRARRLWKREVVKTPLLFFLCFFL